MDHKVWHKPLHKRKIWKSMSPLNKIVYYMQPFVQHLLDVWFQPLPFPTLLKVIYSVILLFFILLPILYPSAICLGTYAIMQFILERHFGIEFSYKWDILGYAQRIYYFQVVNEKYLLFLNLYIERWRLLGAAIASSIDYIRLTIWLLSEMMDS